jgi:hypothetical protein
MISINANKRRMISFFHVYSVRKEWAGCPRWPTSRPLVLLQSSNSTRTTSPSSSLSPSRHCPSRHPLPTRDLRRRRRLCPAPRRTQTGQLKPNKMTGGRHGSSEAGLPCEGLCMDVRRTNHEAQTWVVSTRHTVSRRPSQTRSLANQIGGEE